MRECRCLDPTFLKYDPGDLSKNAIKYFKKGIAPHLRKLTGRVKSFSGLRPQNRVLDTTLD